MLGATAKNRNNKKEKYVSILSQLRCWEQQPKARNVSKDIWFQSSPSLGAGSNIFRLLSSMLSRKFQSSPSLGAGSNLHGGETDLAYPTVSILSQLRCWEQREKNEPKGECKVFQSSPSLGAGSNMNDARRIAACRYVSILSQLRCWEQLFWRHLQSPPIVFQSSPSLGAGSNGTCGNNTY